MRFDREVANRSGDADLCALTWNGFVDVVYVGRAHETHARTLNICASLECRQRTRRFFT